jgi:hypothetical protein
MNKEEKPETTNNSGLPVSIAMGVAIGAALGVATDNLALWLSLGVAIGCGIGVTTRVGSDEDSPEVPHSK